jgi:hypothetical protein
MARHNKVEVNRPEARFALRYFYNYKQFVLAKSSVGRYSFYDIEEIYNQPDFKIVDLKGRKSKEIANQFTVKNMEYIGYDVDIETIDTRFLKQDGYIK